MVAQAAKAPAQVIGYKGSAPLSTDLIGGHVAVAVNTLDTLLPLHEGGKLPILATSGAKRAVASLPTPRRTGLGRHATTPRWQPRWRASCSTWTAAAWPPTSA